MFSFFLRGRLQGAHAPSTAGTATFRRLHRSSHISAGEHKSEGWKLSILRDMRRSRPRPRGPAPWGTIGSPGPRPAAGWCSPGWRGAAARFSARQAADGVSPGSPFTPTARGAPAKALTYPHGRAESVGSPLPLAVPSAKMAAPRSRPGWAGARSRLPLTKMAAATAPPRGMAGGACGEGRESGKRWWRS